MDCRIVGIEKINLETNQEISKTLQIQIENLDIRKFEIINAIYGSKNKYIDLTLKLNQEIKNNRLTFQGNNGYAGNDPAPTFAKEWIIKYRDHGFIKTKSFKENAKIILP